MLETEKRGPALQNRLVGDAEKYKGLLDRESLRAADGVKCFRDTLRPPFIKGGECVSSGVCLSIHSSKRRKRRDVQVDRKVFIAFETLEGFLDGHVAPADVAQENAERLTRSETALDPNAPATPRKVECWTGEQPRKSLFTQ